MNALELVARGLAGAMVGDPERWAELLSGDAVHETHDWLPLDGDKPGGERCCTRCAVCTCHCQELSAKPCKYADEDDNTEADDG